MNEYNLSDLLGESCDDFVGVANIITHINMKLLECLDDAPRRQIYSDLLNDINLLLTPKGTMH